MSPHAERGHAVAAKVTRLRAVMQAHDVDAFLLRQLPNITWLTAGAATYIATSQATRPTTLLITSDRMYVLTDSIEAPRLEQEEALPELGFTLVVALWETPEATVAPLLAGRWVGQDGPGAGTALSDALQTLRTQLQPAEVARLRHSGTLASDILAAVVHAIQQGITEHASRAWWQRAVAHMVAGGVNLVVSDARIAAFRHPLPLAKPIERYVMAVLCLRHSCRRELPGAFWPLAGRADG